MLPTSMSMTSSSSLSSSCAAPCAPCFPPPARPRVRLLHSTASVYLSFSPFIFLLLLYLPIIFFTSLPHPLLSPFSTPAVSPYCRPHPDHHHHIHRHHHHHQLDSYQSYFHYHSVAIVVVVVDVVVIVLSMVYYDDGDENDGMMCLISFPLFPLRLPARLCLIVTPM